LNRHLLFGLLNTHRYVVNNIREANFYLNHNFTMKLKEPTHTLDYIKSEAEKLTNEERGQVLTWVQKHFIEAKGIPDHYGSYAFKHWFERDGGFYMTNAQFKQVLLDAGFSAEMQGQTLSDRFKIKPRQRLWNRIPGHAGYEIRQEKLARKQAVIDGKLRVKQMIEEMHQERMSANSVDKNPVL
jgi:hypothetical protein